VGSALRASHWGLPAGFMIEEVFFRGFLDTYLQGGEDGTGWLSAVFVSGPWGLWHLRGSALRGPRLLSRVVQLLFAQIVVGVPLSLWWRRSGSLAVNNTTHARRPAGLLRGEDVRVRGDGAPRRDTPR